MKLNEIELVRRAWTLSLYELRLKLVKALNDQLNTHTYLQISFRNTNFDKKK